MLLNKLAVLYLTFYIKEFVNAIIMMSSLTIYLLIFTLNMNKKILKLQQTNNIFDDIQRYLKVNQHQNHQKPSTTASKHSKSLYYYSNKGSAAKSKNRTGVVTA
jgi:hypothetical protein